MRTLRPRSLCARWPTGLGCKALPVRWRSWLRERDAGVGRAALGKVRLGKSPAEISLEPPFEQEAEPTATG